MIFCGRCGKSLQSDRNHLGTPMYRERHSVPCETNNRATVARPLDEQIGKIIGGVELDPEWRCRMAQLATAKRGGPDLATLQDQRRRLGRAYADGAFSEAEYEARAASIDSRIRQATTVVAPALEQAVALFEDVPGLWEDATLEERRRLLRPLVERVYVDITTKRVGAIVPAPGFRLLLENAAKKASRFASPLLIPWEEAERLDVWTWWRRGRIELPVQKKNVLSLLQA
jgi:hypothetical protein